MESEMKSKTEDRKPKLSVVAIGRDAAQYLPRSLGSVLKQMTDDVELVFVDDASTDTTASVVETLVGEKPNVTLLKNERPRGPGGARNVGVQNAKGEYVWFVDGDDWITDGAVERVMKALGEGKDLVLLPFTIRTPNGDQPRLPSVVQKLEQAIGWPISQCDAAFRRELYVPMPEQVFAEDVVWHFMQYDRFSSYTSVEGDEPVYVWDCTVPGATTRTVEWFWSHPMTLEQLAFENVLPKAGLKDKYVSDCLRNIANLYDVRNSLKQQWVRDGWANYFRSVVSRCLSGHIGH